MTRKKPPPPAGPRTPFHNPFGGLAERLGVVPEPEPVVTSDAAAPRPPAAPGRAVVRLERKGRGGKEATIVAKLELPAAELLRWSIDLKRALGCGGGVEDDALVLHGDQRARAKAWLEARGVRKVTLG